MTQAVPVLRSHSTRACSQTCAEEKGLSWDTRSDGTTALSEARCLQGLGEVCYWLGGRVQEVSSPGFTSTVVRSVSLSPFASVTFR